MWYDVAVSEGGNIQVCVVSVHINLSKQINKYYIDEQILKSRVEGYAVVKVHDDDEKVMWSKNNGGCYVYA